MKKRVKLLYGACVFTAAVFIFHSFLQAGSVQVKTIKSDGSLELSDGRQVRLAGIVFLPETRSQVAALVAGRDVDVEEDKKRADSGGLSAVYLYVKVRQTSFPPKPKESEEIKFCVNKWVLERGAARLDDTAVFSRLQEFRTAETTAKDKGEGIWSYEKKP